MVFTFPPPPGLYFHLMYTAIPSLTSTPISLLLIAQQTTFVSYIWTFSSYRPSLFSSHSILENLT